MLRLIALSMSLLLAGALTDPVALAQGTPSTSTRKVLSRMAPVYPALASKMNLEGAVKMVVTVAPDGSVKSVEIRGGHPLLVNAAENAIYKWKWAPANQESKELVEMTFQRP
jgi:TonB family protein